MFLTARPLVLETLVDGGYRITQELNKISKQIDADMTQRKGLVDQYNKRVTEFNAQMKRLKPVVQ